MALSKEQHLFEFGKVTFVSKPKPKFLFDNLNPEAKQITLYPEAMRQMAQDFGRLQQRATILQEEIDQDLLNPVGVDFGMVKGGDKDHYTKLLTESARTKITLLLCSYRNKAIMQLKMTFYPPDKPNEVRHCKGSLKLSHNDNPSDLQKFVDSCLAATAAVPET
jgi:hypothetical protein